MRRFPFAILLGMLGAAASAVAAQARSQPTLALTIVGGAVSGHSLWRVGRQPFERLGSAPNFISTGQYDTLALTRSIGSSLMLGVAATFYRSAHVGLQLELSYLSFPFENGCAGVFYNTDPENKNEQLCDNIAATQLAASGLGAHAGITVRATPRGAFSPYVRAGVGLTSTSRSSTAMAGAFVAGGGVYTRDIVVDTKPVKTAVSLLFGVGLTTPLSPGYQVRLELRDVLARLNRLDGPADVSGSGPSSTKLYHHLALTLGLDVVLEQKRGRRY